MISPRLFLAAAGAAGLTSPLFADLTLQLYDVRDLATLLPRTERGTVPASQLGTRVDEEAIEKVKLRYVEMMMLSEKPSAPERPAVLTPVDEFMMRLCGALSVNCTKLTDGVFTVEAEQNQHEQLGKLISSTFDLYRGKYEADIVCYAAKAASAPAIGSAPAAGEPLSRTRATLGRRVPMVLEAIERVSYLEDWTPVVSDQVASFDPQTAVIEKGLRLTVTVGGPDVPTAENKDQPLFVRLNGTYADLKLDEREIPGVGSGPPNAFISMPTASCRSVNSEMKLTPGQAAVVAVVPGVAPGDVIVIAATVRPLN